MKFYIYIEVWNTWRWSFQTLNFARTGRARQTKDEETVQLKKYCTILRAKLRTPSNFIAANCIINNTSSPLAVMEWSEESYFCLCYASEIPLHLPSWAPPESQTVKSEASEILQHYQWCKYKLQGTAASTHCSHSWRQHLLIWKTTMIPNLFMKVYPESKPKS